MIRENMVLAALNSMYGRPTNKPTPIRLTLALFQAITDARGRNAEMALRDKMESATKMAVI